MACRPSTATPSSQPTPQLADQLAQLQATINAGELSQAAAMIDAIPDLRDERLLRLAVELHIGHNAWDSAMQALSRMASAGCPLQNSDRLLGQFCQNMIALKPDSTG